MMADVKIISDGTAQGTSVHVGDEVMRGVTRIEIEPISVGGLVTARITVNMAALRMRLSKAQIECSDIVAKAMIEQVMERVAEEPNSASAGASESHGANG